MPARRMTALRTVALRATPQTLGRAPKPAVSPWCSVALLGLPRGVSRQQAGPMAVRIRAARREWAERDPAPEPAERAAVLELAAPALLVKAAAEAVGAAAAAAVRVASPHCLVMYARC